MTVVARTLAGGPDSVAEARGWVADVLRVAGCENRSVEAAVLVVSELVSNAVRHTASGYSVDGVVRVEVLIGAHRLCVRVIDAGTDRSAPVVPRARPDPDVAEAPRGLYLVDLWAERLVVQGGAQGRTVFADIAASSGSEAVDGAAAVVLPKRALRAGVGGNGRQRSA